MLCAASSVQEPSAATKVALMRHVSALLFYYQFEYFDISIAYVPAITAAELSTPAGLQLAMAEALLKLAANFWHRPSALRHLGLWMHLRILDAICTARAMLFKCGPEEAALMEAASHLKAWVVRVLRLPPPYLPLDQSRRNSSGRS